VLAGRPNRRVETPESVARLAGAAATPVWENEVGGLTFAVGNPVPSRYIKWVPAGSGIDLPKEAAKLAWAAPFASVPTVLDLGADEEGEWLVTAALPGENAVADRWRANPAEAVGAIAGGLRRLHDSLPVASCPYSWSAADRLLDARRRRDAGLLDPSRWHVEHQQMSVDEALRTAAQSPPVDALVVCHGDACAPNTIIGADARCVGHVDLGSLGVGDRWADLAVASWSADWNYGPGWSGVLLEAYGVEADHGRIAYYRLLWDLDP
jgi:kanamycin kinase